ncbi:MAG: BatA domain-containing protein, partial [candidate division KSB1 bacterium]|nr:BatA domain-containing protein [candidate division KSB1 bacterium]
MSFLNPSILFGLAAAAVPLLIHLLTRTKRRIIPFSTLRFLKEIQYQQSRRLKLRQLLLLILRTAVVALLVLAFARPTLNRAPISGGKARTAAALIIDNSMSMNRYVKGRSLFEEAKEKALTVLRSSEAGDRMFILTATDTSAEWNRMPFAPGPLAEKQVSDLKLSYKRTNLTAALQAAARRIGGLAELNKEIYIFSDLQQSGFVDPFTPPASCRVYAAPCTASETANLAIRDVAVKSLLLRGRTAEVEVMLTNTGNQPLQESVVRLFVNDKAAAQTSVSTVGGAETMETLRFTVETTGPMVLRVDAEDDDLLEDN